MKPGQVEIIQLLKNGSVANGKEQTYAINVTDAEKFHRIHTKITGDKMLEDFGGVEEYFNYLAKNYNSVAIELLRKNGSAYRPHTNEAPVTFNFKQKPIQAQPQPSQEATPNPSFPAPTHSPGNIIPGLMGGFGLNGMDMAYKYQDYPKVEAERDKLRDKVEALTERVAELKEELLKKDYSDTKASGNKEVITTLMGSLPDILAAFAAKSATPGLASPAPAEEALSEIKQAVVSQVKNQSDAVCQYLWFTLVGITNNAEFATELEQLISKHKLTDNAGQ
ncbi:hypothetical protein V1389_01995 [Flavobacterium rakeshii]|uniref:hypothetical protein n=1 Tax=Flavobacterium rakeshii TaxID=1038845 RepID=UPI002E7AC07A|nr:hypothetical protein [Flavobacterium rakeshii]MEE1897088.1 hypothetical protein [Flavobacterium rakeshii]